MTLDRRTPLRRRKALSRGGGTRRRNEKRKREKMARNFGDEADAVRAMPCLVHRQLAIRGGWGASERFIDEPSPTGWTECSGAIADAHVRSRGAGGGRFDVVPLCDGHHTEQHQHGIETFAAKYRLDLRAEADRIALEHAAPLGIRGLGERLADGWPDAEHVSLPDVFAWVFGRDHYDGHALLGLVRRRMEREVNFRRICREEQCWPDGLPDNDREALAHAVMLDLGEPFTSDPSGEHGLAWSLCEVAGWPEVDRG